MMRRLFFIVSGMALAAPAALRAQAPPTPAAGFQRLPSGVEYKLFRRDAAGRYQPRPLVVATDSAYATRQGRFLLAHLSFLTGRDSLLQSSRPQLRGRPAPVPLQPVSKKGGQEEALSLLLPGDSAVFRFSADSLVKGSGRPVPPELKRGGNVLVMQVAATRLASQAQVQAMMQQYQQEMQAEQAAEQQRQMAEQQRLAPERQRADEAAIAAYLQQHNLTASAHKTPGGTWYVISKRGTGPLPYAGRPVKVKYRGTVLATGKEFDSSERHGGEPIEFPLGQGQVIPGWDQGIAMLPVGSQATLLIPSALAYGPRGAGADIPPNAPLRFDVEVISSTPPPAPAKTPAKKATASKTPAKAPVKNAAGKARR